MRCTEFWNNKFEDVNDDTLKCKPCQPTELECCRCNLFGMSHKRTSSCDVFEVITQSALRKRDKAGIKSQKHILKERDNRITAKNTHVSNGKRRKK